MAPTTGELTKTERKEREKMAKTASNGNKDNKEKNEALYEELAALLDRHGRGARSGTPEFILASYLMGCLEAYEEAATASGRYCRVKEGGP